MNTFKITIREGNAGNWSVETELTRATDRLPVHYEGRLNLSKEKITELDSLILQRQQYGKLLGEALFQEKIYEAYLQAVDSSSQEGMRILLTVEDNTLGRLYWHWLCAPRDWNFISLNQRCCFSIGLKSSTERVFPQINQHDLKALILVANPQGLKEDYDLAPFDVQQTVNYLKTALGDIPTDVLAIEEGLGKPTLDQLCHHLTRIPYTILHIVGHGWVNQQGETVLYWTTEDDQVAPIEASYLIERLEKITQLPRFVFLCACESAKIEARMAFGGLAQRMVRELGIPAVLAMTEKVTIETAKLLSQAFYPRLRKHGEVDKALVEATSSLSRYDILVPALFSRSGGNSLFDHYKIQLSDEKIKQRELKKNSPYKGLKKFNFRDQEYFFGRDALIDKLFMAVNQSSFTLVLGASGSGKSSVVRAGLIPELKKSLEPQTFYDFIFTPDQDPFDSLYRCLLSEEKDYSFSKAEAEIALKAQADTLTKVISTLKKDEERWLIFVDQFEELFTICDDPDKRKNFISGLVQVAKSGNNSVKILLAMRSDFLEQFSFYPDLGVIANQNNIHLVTEMYPDELQQAIEQPAAKHGVVFEEGLVKQIIEEVEGQKGYLPLLQYTLNLLWESECQTLGADGRPQIEDRTLNKKSYAALEGVRGALQKRVNEIYKDVCERGKDGETATKQIFLKLVNIVDSDSESRVVSRRAYRYEFVGKPVENTLKRFVDENLLVSSYEYSSEEELLVEISTKSRENATIEIAHEILLSSWDRLKRWLEEEKEAIILKNWLAGETRRWLEVRAKDESKANDELLKGSRLDQIVEFREKNAFEKLGGLVQEENEFIDASVEWRESARAEKIRLQRRAIKWLSVGLTAALIAASVAFYQWQRSEQLRLATEAEALGSTAVQQFESGRQIEALVLAMQSGRILKNLIPNSHSLNNRYPAVSPLFALQTILDGINERNRLEYLGGSTLFVNGAGVSRTSFSSDGKYIVRIPEHGLKEYWDLSGKLVDQSVQSNRDTTSNIKPSPIKECVVPLGDDRTIRLRYLQEQQLDQRLTQLLAQLTGHSDRILSIRCSPNGKYVVTSGTDGTVRLFDLSKKQIAKIIGRQVGVTDIRFNPDGQNFATLQSSWGNVLFWDLSKSQMAQHMTLLNGNQGSVTAISFSQDGNYIATAGTNGTVHLWDSAGKKISPEIQIGQKIMGVKFIRDGKQIVTVTDTGTIQISNLAGKPIQTVLKKPQNQSIPVISVSFSPDGNYIAMALAGGSVELRKITGEKLPGSFAGHQGWIMGVSFSRDDKFIATAGADDTIRLWNLLGQQIKEIRARQGQVMSVSLSPNGKFVVSAGDDGTIRLWNLQSKKQVAVFSGHQGKVLGVNFSPVGNFVASAGTDGTIRLWTLSGEQIAQFIGYSSGHSSEVTGGSFGSLGMSFSPDGRQIATAGDQGVAKLWHIETLDELLNRGCEWLKDYLAAHPDAPKVCP